MDSRTTLPNSRPLNRPPRPSKGSALSRQKILGMAFGAGLVATLLAYFWLQSLNAPPKAQKISAIVPVVVAARDIPARTLVTQDMVAVHEAPRDTTSPDALKATSDVVGKVTMIPIAAGQPVVQQSVTSRGIDMGMSFAIPPDHRAISIALDPVSGVAGFIKPGDHVDILATFKADKERSVTHVVLQDVPLLATGSKALPGFNKEAEKPDGTPETAPGGAASKPEEIRTATVLVSPEQAQTLVLAAASGKLQLALRAPNDTARSSAPKLMSTIFIPLEAKPSNAFFRPAPAAPVRPTPPVAAPTSSVKPIVAQAPAPPKPTHEVTLAGVMLGRDGFAMLTSGPKVWYKRIGEPIAGHRVRRLTEQGIVLRTSNSYQQIWNVGETRTVTE